MDYYCLSKLACRIYFPGGWLDAAGVRIRSETGAKDDRHGWTLCGWVGIKCMVGQT